MLKAVRLVSPEGAQMVFSPANGSIEALTSFSVKDD